MKYDKEFYEINKWLEEIECSPIKVYKQPDGTYKLYQKNVELYHIKSDECMKMFIRAFQLGLDSTTRRYD